MNIFEVLSQGRSRLNEPSISAFFAYLLQPGENHGLGDSFLSGFLKLALKETLSDREPTDVWKLENTEVLLEEPLSGGKDTYYVDLLVNLEPMHENSAESPRVSLLIENKLRPGAARQSQLKNYYSALRTDSDPEVMIMLLLLCPATTSRRFDEALEAVTRLSVGDRKGQINWNSEDGVIALLQSILEQELRGEINPINDYTRHTIKAFMKRMRDLFSSKPRATQYRRNEDIGTIRTRSVYQLNGSEVEIIRRSSTQIQITIDGEKAPAMDTLRRINDAENFGIDPTGMNTRRFGKAVLDAMQEEYGDGVG